MTNEAKQEYLKAIEERYRLARKKDKKQILDEFCSVCGFTRKYAIRLLSGKATIRSTKPGPRVWYGEDFTIHLAALWRAMGCLCSKKFVAAVEEWLPYYCRSTRISKQVREQLLSVSAATVDRILKHVRVKDKKGFSSTRPSPAWIKSRIPIELLHGTVKEPGFIEADTVAHCGNSLSGCFAYTLTMTDLYSGWTENRASWTKSAGRVLARIEEIETNLPFPILGFSTDSGSEFVNALIMHYMRENRIRPVKFTRRRPYKKNDAAHVEQKNWTHVRQLFGYARVDDLKMVGLMNEIYEAYWNPLLNFFIPTMKLIKKERVGGKLKKYYDEPKTPYQRILESKNINPGIKEKLKVQKSWLDPFALRRELEKRLKDFQKLTELAEKRRQMNSDTAA